MTKLVLSTVLFVAMSQCMSMADNWAHWRGPTGNGVAANAHPPIEWSSTKNVKWKVAIPGRSSGSPVIWEQRVFVVTAVPTGNEAVGKDPAQQPERPEPPRRPQSQGNKKGGKGKGRGRPGGGGDGGATGGVSELAFKILCFDRSTGKLLWEQTATIATPHQRTHTTNGFASASPCTDGQHVYVHFGSRGLYCYTMDGKLVWNRNFGQMDTRSSFGEGSSPTLEGGKILVPWDHEGSSYLYALDKLTGETIWKAERDEPMCWATPLVVEHNGAKQVVMNGQTCARAYDLETGKELWRCGGRTGGTQEKQKGVIGLFNGQTEFNLANIIKPEKQSMAIVKHSKKVIRCFFCRSPGGCYWQRDKQGV